MSLVTAFICELIRAANEVEKLTPHEISRLLDRSVDTIREMREQTEAAGNSRAKDVVVDLQIVSSRVKDFSAEDVRDTLIDAAEIIRALKIILDEHA